MDIEELIENFELLGQWEDRYRYIIELGRKIPEFNPENRIEQYLVRGCQSQVWITGEEQPTGWEFKLDSDSYMVKGIGNVLCRCMSGMTADEISQVGFYDFRDLTQYFSQQRKQGMQAVINKCKQISRG